MARSERQEDGRGAVGDHDQRARHARARALRPRPPPGAAPRAPAPAGAAAGRRAARRAPAEVTSGAASRGRGPRPPVRADGPGRRGGPPANVPGRRRTPGPQRAGPPRSGRAAGRARGPPDAVRAAAVRPARRRAVSALVISTTLAEGSFQINKLQDSTSSARDGSGRPWRSRSRRRSRHQVIEQRASQLGMRRPGELRFVDLKTGKIRLTGPRGRGRQRPGYTP